MKNLNIALAKGRVADQAIQLLMDCGCQFDDYSKDSRKLIFSDKKNNIKVTLVKSPDVPVYVEKGAADAGIVGKDILLEEKADVYELVNLNIGKCHMCVAGFADKKPDYSKKITVATKYPNITKDHFHKLGVLTDIIKLNGSVELAPLIGLSDIIVDIVESGKTLEENGLVVHEKFLPISARLISNKVSLKTKNEEIQWVIRSLASLADQEGS
ncbi:ATP phosphoribosyltransferase [Alkalibacter rhizosphaerae]|uniref:ATP phosphoribosyltransferase n=1 Tax=Alkalibacter rhizosphaerae TaxID=2815577 RepID=A0A975AGJ6_9FIRM|nr:ATP phosphoribosyltransferase [Alkalibacter rhizosphaerae]QSX07609.1 ATP phosphoribosyltransferase [Alkalibacter rhizosphaerae]